MRKLAAVLVPAVAVAAIIAGCGGGSSKTVNIPGGGKVSVSDKVPDNFPKDFPVYSGAKVQQSSTGSAGGITGTNVFWETGDSVDKVTEFYTKAFKDGPWKSQSTGNVSGSSFFLASSSDGKKSAYVAVASTDGKTTIVTTVGDNPSGSGSSGDGGSGDSKTSTSGSSSSSKKTATPDDSSSASPDKSPTSEPLPKEVKLPKDYPTDRIPLPSGARVTSATSFSGSGTKTYSVEFYVKGKPETITAFFETELPKHGWEKGFSSESNGEYVATYTSTDASASATEGVTVSAGESDTAGYATGTLIISIAG